jgi:CBF1 interacting corepressor
LRKEMPGLSFLLLKPWHPSNKTNQKRIWIAEQEAKDRQKRETEAALEILKEQEKESLEQALQLQRDEKERSLKFMYNAPPGLKQGGPGAEDDDDLAALAEDDAVRKFRERLKLKKDPNFSASAQQSRLEQEAGMRHRAGMTVDEQVEKFPFLKGAPVEGEYAKNVQVTFKPLGKSVRNVRCMRCGEWGHKSGDRECPMRNYNPHDLARQRREDPMTYMQTQLLQDKQSLILKRSALPSEMLGVEGLNGHELVLSDEGTQDRDAIHCNDSPGRRVWADAAALVTSTEEDADPEATFLASLSTKEKKLLLHKIQQLEALTGSEDIVSDLSQINPAELHATLTALSREASKSAGVADADTLESDNDDSDHHKRKRSKKPKHKSSKALSKEKKKKRRRRRSSSSSSDEGSSSDSSSDSDR